MLNMNCALILLPVCRNFMSWPVQTIYRNELMPYGCSYELVDRCISFTALA